MLVDEVKLHGVRARVSGANGLLREAVKLHEPCRFPLHVALKPLLFLLPIPFSLKFREPFGGYGISALVPLSSALGAGDAVDDIE